MKLERNIPTEFETERLLLRILQLRDAPVIQELVSDRLIAETTLNIPHPYPENGAVEFVQRVRKAHEPGENYPLAIVRQADQQFMGIIGLHPRHGHMAEVGYWLGVPYWGEGYMTEALRRVIQFGFENLGLNRIHASYFHTNPASGRVMAKAGMTSEGVMRQHVVKWGTPMDLHFYSILRTEFREGL